MGLQTRSLSEVGIAAVLGLVFGVGLGLGSPSFAQEHHASHSFSKKALQQLVEEFNTNPHAALEMMTSLVNQAFKNHMAGEHLNNIIISLKYAAPQSTGEVSAIELVPTAKEMAHLQLVVHPLTQKNPFFLLETVVDFNNLFDLGNLTAYEENKIFGHHGYVVDYHTSDYSVQDYLGIPGGAFLHQATAGSDSIFLQMNPFEYLELKANADGGSIFSQRRWMEMKYRNFQVIKNTLATFTPVKNLNESQKKAYLSEYAKAKGIALSSRDSYEDSLREFIDKIDLRQKQQLDALNAQAKKVYRQQVEAYKAQASEREAVVKNQSLSEMIKANDREGVALAMEKMLPWSIMEPTEKSFWTDFVDSIRHPNYDNATILFRGLDKHEKLQTVLDSSGRVIGAGMFSKRLTAGSGSHFFKLKGLPETFEKFGTNGVLIGKRISPLSQPHSLTKMMFNHASDPNGSPFLSLTYDLRTAYSFSDGHYLEVKTTDHLEKAKAAFLKTNSAGGLATIRIDPRRLLINSISHHPSELEVLAAMFVFPDEVLYLEKGTKFSINYTDIPDSQFGLKYKMEKIGINDYYQRARHAVYQKTGITLPEDYNQLKKKGEKQFLKGIKDLEALFVKVAVQKKLLCERVFR